jgi:hypothetical protein
MLEEAGVTFGVTARILPPKLDLEKLIGFSRLIKPAVSQRRIRQHINFAIDISSYPLEEAKSYIRNLARFRMNSLTLHIYQRQWYPYPLDGGKALAGNFFYGQRHDIPDIEAFYDRPEEKSRRAMEWLRSVIEEARPVGLTVNFSLELRTDDMDRSLETGESVIEHYPMIDGLELISQEDIENSAREIEHNMKVIWALREKREGKRGPRMRRRDLQHDRPGPQAGLRTHAPYRPAGHPSDRLAGSWGAGRGEKP